MKVSLPYFRNFPKNFQQAALNRISEAAGRGENLQLVGLKGSGKSLIFRAVIESNEKFSDYKIFNFDLGMLPERSPKELLNLLAPGIKSAKGKQKTIILLDSFENVLEVGGTELIKVLHSIYDSDRDYLTLVFSVERVIGPFDSLFGRAYFVEPLAGADLEWFFGGIESAWGKKIGKITKDKIIKASGGYMAVVKRLMEAFFTGEDVGRLIADPSRNAHLLYLMQLMDEGLRGESNYFDVPVYETFLELKNRQATGEEFLGSTKIRARLTALEYKILKNLYRHREEIVSRDESVTAAWGEKAVGIAEHALDQIIYRLGRKLKAAKSPVTIETVRGRGHRLN